MKFDILQNPNGILFDPDSVAKILVSYVQNKRFSESDIFYLNEVWQSWLHHSRFSGVQKEQVLGNINNSQAQAHSFLTDADWLIITLGSSFSYRLSEEADVSRQLIGRNSGVVNCHRAPAAWFNKHLMTISEIVEVMDEMIHQVFYFNNKVNIIFTVSPVRHIRDGVIENNRSKARLTEAVHHLVNKFDRLHYFPAYELVIDVLRDYRYYDIDLVHPNYLATEFVLAKFVDVFMSDETVKLAGEVKKLVIAKKHKPTHPTTKAHQKFLQTHCEMACKLQEKYPYLKLGDEINYFSGLM
jgi:hypothetical protein